MNLGIYEQLYALVSQSPDTLLMHVGGDKDRRETTYLNLLGVATLIQREMSECSVAVYEEDGATEHIDLKHLATDTVILAALMIKKADVDALQ